MGQPLSPKHFTAPECFGSYLSALLETHRLSVFGLSEMTGLEPDFISQLLGGRQILTADVAFSLAEVFGGSPLTLLEVQRGGALGAREQGAAPQLAA